MNEGIGDIEVGEYTSQIFKKGVNESSLKGVKEGDLFFTACIAEGHSFDFKEEDQIQAELLCRLVRIENMLKGNL